MPPSRGSGCDFASTWACCLTDFLTSGCVCTLDYALRRGSVFCHVRLDMINRHSDPFEDMIRPDTRVVRCATIRVLMTGAELV